MAVLATLQDLEVSPRDRETVPHSLHVQPGQAGMGRRCSTVGCTAGKVELGSGALEVIRIVVDQEHGDFPGLQLIARGARTLLSERWEEPSRPGGGGHAKAC